MKQYGLFGEELESKEESDYTFKIKTPTYEPKNKKPHVMELYDPSKANKIIAEIAASEIPEEEKKFLIEAAKRHNVFFYKKIADYYAHATPEVQRLMERSALVIVDFDNAIRNGYVKFSEEIIKNYIEEHGEA